MNSIKWNDQYITGHTTIDFQHKILAGIINDLIEAKRNEAADELWVDVVVDELMSYTQYHIATETELMKSYHYPGITDHSSKYADFVLELKKLSGKHTAEKTKLTDDHLTFLKNWLVDHIAVEGKNLCRFLQEKEDYKLNGV
ncbi:MAG: hypothetical protein CR997_00465 [Acidobacteria bacterium]|nr:MAG: hypothetical protein CR997_00465 [Acidobacteriota bacterium]